MEWIQDTGTEIIMLQKLKHDISLLDLNAWTKWMLHQVHFTT